MPLPLNRIIIFVGDVQKCARFYVDVLQFKVASPDPASTEWIDLDTGGCRLALHKAYGPTGTIDTPTGGPMNPHKIVFSVSDVEATREELVSRGAPMGAIQRFEEFDLILCDGTDPEGHVFQICNQ